MGRAEHAWRRVGVFVGVWLAVLSIVALTGCGRSGFSFGQVRGAQPTGLEDPVQGSCDKVDFLFVIDNSPSMGDKQAALAASVPGFVAGLEETLGTLRSIHVGVTTTDLYEGNVEECARPGGLIVRTSGHNSSQQSCGPYAAGGSYMTEADPLEESFACAVSVGTAGGTYERPLYASQRAVSDELLGDGACNAGFIRDDALLVLVIVSDEDAKASPEDTYEQLVERKLGFDDNVVVVSLVNDEAGPCEPRLHSTYAPALVEFTGMFEHGFVGPVCAEDYEPTFRQAIDVVQAACR